MKNSASLIKSLAQKAAYILIVYLILTYVVRNWNEFCWGRRRHSHISVAVSPDGEIFATGRRSIIVKETKSGEKLQELNSSLLDKIVSSKAISIAIAPDNQTLAIASQQAKPDIEIKYSLQLWDITKRETIQTLAEDRQHRITFLDISPDGEILISESDNGLVELWDISEGKIIKTITVKKASRFPIIFNADKSTFVSMHPDGTIQFWNTDGSLLKTLSANPVHTPLAISADGKTLLIQNAGDVKRFVDIATGKELLTLQNVFIESPFATTPDNKFVLIQDSDLVIHLYNLNTASIVRTFEGHSRYNKLAVSPDGKFFVSLDSMGDYKVWDIETGAEIARIPNFVTLGDRSAFIPNTTKLINARRSGIVTTVDLSTGEKIHSFCHISF